MEPAPLKPTINVILKVFLYKCDPVELYGLSIAGKRSGIPPIFIQGEIGLIILSQTPLKGRSIHLKFTTNNPRKLFKEVKISFTSTQHQSTQTPYHPRLANS